MGTWFESLFGFEESSIAGAIARALERVRDCALDVHVAHYRRLNEAMLP